MVTRHTAARLGGRKTWDYSTNTVVATVANLLLLDTSLLSQAGIIHYSQLLTLQHSTKLVCVFFKSIFQSSDHHTIGVGSKFEV